jgi:hypothetical protein
MVNITMDAANNSHKGNLAGTSEVLVAIARN